MVAALTLLGSLWWLVPLFLLGGYSPPFLDYIEAAANTTFPTTLFDALRRHLEWVPYVDTASRAGNELLRQTYLVANSAVVLVLGLVGLALRRNRHRGFLLSGLLVGLFLVTMGHSARSRGGSPRPARAAGRSARSAAQRAQVRPVLRLPWRSDWPWSSTSWSSAVRVPRAPPDPTPCRTGHLQGMVGICVLAVVAAASPIVLGRVTPPGGSPTSPATGAPPRPGSRPSRTRAPPCSSRGRRSARYVWGSPRDEPLQSLARKPWAVRNAVPLAPAGNIRMLDSIEARLAQGRGGTGLVRLLVRSGVSTSSSATT